MDDMRLKVRDFFARYQAFFENALGDDPTVDVDGIVNAFADYFVESSPAGVHGGANDEQFQAAIPQGYAFYRQIGTTSMKVAGLDVTPVDDHHAMARVHWVSTYTKQDGGTDTIEFDNVYFLTLVGKTPKIFAYVTGDEQGGDAPVGAGARQHRVEPHGAFARGHRASKEQRASRTRGLRCERSYLEESDNPYTHHRPAPHPHTLKFCRGFDSSLSHRPILPRASGMSPLRESWLANTHG